MGTGRLESFSDGVLAVAITLLVLNIAVPGLNRTANGATLAHHLASQWPVYAAYVTSFLTIGIIWINHHAMISRLARADHSILILNLLLLLTVAVIPFATSLFAEYLRADHGAKLAAGVYGGILLAMALAFSALDRQMMLRRPQLLKDELSLEQRRRILARARAGLIPYVIAAGLAAVSPYATLVICLGLAVFYALPVASGIGI
ncbi:MAG TPA: TMEM175 family protein [Solirubrobacteraceae bacterium]|nr:TMEM175 family protein [Solirubrobacteraceae bacterium]